MIGLIFSKIKLYGYAILGAALAVLYALLQIEKAGRARDQVAFKKAELRALAKANKAKDDAAKQGEEFKHDIAEDLDNNDFSVLKRGVRK